MTNTDTSPRRWHSQSNPALRDSLDTIDAHQLRVTDMCISLAAFMGHKPEPDPYPDFADEDWRLESIIRIMGYASAAIKQAQEETI